MIGRRLPLLARWLIFGEWRAHPLRTLVAIGAIAIGVALAFTIHLINAAAFNEFSAAVKSVSGQSDLQVHGTQDFLDENLYPQLAQRPEIALASPVLELKATVPGKREALKLLGIDVFQASAIAPDLIGTPAEDKTFDTLADDAVFLSPAAMEWLQVAQGDRLEFLVGTRTVSLRVAGGLVRSRAGQRIAVMDIGAAQWRFGRVGRLSHIDIKLVAGVNRSTFKQALARDLGPHYQVTETADEEARTANMSRAYRANLNMLALVALFTGGFLVFSTQALSVLRRRSQIALLRVAGMTRRQVLGQMLTEGASLGVAGSLLGLTAGYAIAATALHFFGGDLGGGYFPGVRPSVEFSLPAATAFLVLGTAAALLGCAGPAWEAASTSPAPALKSGSEDQGLSRLTTPWPALACIATGAVLTQLPPLFALPVFGYLAIILLLVGSIALMPRLAALIFSLLSARCSRGAIPTLTLARLANAPNQAAIALGGVLASFSLMVAMAIMVSSLRVSVDDWLTRVLPADLYVRPAESGDTAGLSAREQQAIVALPAIERVEFLRLSSLALDPNRPEVVLIARSIDINDPGKALPLVGEAIATDAMPGGVIPIWVSEAMVDLYAYAPGSVVRLSIGSQMREFLVAGVWRDYARQSGSIQMRLSDYRRLTGDHDVNDAALWLRPGMSAEQAVAQLKALPFGAALKFSLPEEIQAMSLRIFDRSFTITYLLEAVAIVIGLFGIAATFSAQTLARAREFGMLRHVGVMRRQVLAMLAIEGGLLTLLGIAVGFLLGGAISLILIFVVNPQSFHWSMQVHLPWELLLGVASVLLLAASVTAVMAGRHAISGDVVRAVREDW